MRIQVFSLLFFLLCCRPHQNTSGAKSTSATSAKISSTQILYIPVPADTPSGQWLTTDPLPQQPVDFPRLPDTVRGIPEKYIPWLAKVFLTSTYPIDVRLFALMKFKQEYWKDVRYQNSIETDIENIVTQSNINIQSLNQIQLVCERAQQILAVISGVRLLIAIPALVQSLSAGMSLFVGPVTGNLSLALAGGGTMAAGNSVAIASSLSLAQVQSLVAAGLISTGSLTAANMYRNRSSDYESDGYGGGGFRSNRGGGGNNARNDEVTSIYKELKLNKAQQRMLHDEITGMEYTRAEILEIGKAMFGL